MSIVDLSENRLHILHESDWEVLEHSKVQEIANNCTWNIFDGFYSLRCS